MEKNSFEADLTKPIDYNNEYHQAKFGKWLEEDIYKLKGLVAKKNIFSYDFDEDSKVLEFGAGIGQITAWIKNKYTFDINKELYPLLKEKGFITFDSIEEIPENFFDEIVISQCLEHIENPVELIKKLSQKLKCNGKIRLNLPTASYHHMEDMNSSNNGHYFAWGFQDINYLLNRCGFEVIYNNFIGRKGLDFCIPIYRLLGFKAYYLLINILGFIFKSGGADIIIVGRKTC